ncbi:hypothetical protein SDC9_188669 [bioreactor metagenome]|uniref:Uncharacterized protein n=1 Tax=bioreactor metagenome TaxID=1076179 RepID=A0A645HQ71_9ZZZZ
MEASVTFHAVSGIWVVLSKDSPPSRNTSDFQGFLFDGGIIWYTPIDDTAWHGTAAGYIDNGGTGH